MNILSYLEELIQRQLVIGYKIFFIFRWDKNVKKWMNKKWMNLLD